MSRAAMSKKYKNRPNRNNSGSSLMKSDASLSRLSERKAVFNSSSDPRSWRLPVPSPTQEYRAVTTYDTTAYLTTSTSGEVDVGSSFSLSNMNAAELAGYQAVFDQARIRWVELMLIPRVSNVIAGPANTGKLVTAVDFDSSAAITQANLETFTNSLASSGSVAHYRAFQPCVTLGVGSSTGSSVLNVVSVVSPWLDLAVTTTPHYGFKVAVSQTDAVYIYDLFVRLHLAFRMKI